MTGFDIPLEVIDAARLVAHWFDEKGIKDWELCGVRSRTQTWQPIETAPKDGLLLGYGHGGYELMWWDGERFQCENSCDPRSYATRWMPLPDYPT